MKTMPEIRIDRSKTLVEEPGIGHNRWRPDIRPVIRCDPGDEVILETRDAFDRQMGPDARGSVTCSPSATPFPARDAMSVSGLLPHLLDELDRAATNSERRR